ncbi:Epimerase family protein YfcH [Pseudomonas sp. OF001]|uniref:TIGR01777 family oxidoreductase n=1 Tax=Pseudomonas sp. OF001 TaxID=2772300 RepID=UPI00191AE96B|nr:TIGR01777 family oxidoreductase [Pseudomonas sp. OF001]CAD5379753.1 Epimerase family protein YfcH [Pseudomonas sp. OF001]
MRILLTGGTGLIGRALCRLWAGQGHELVVWSRRPQEVAGLCSGARGIARLDELAPDLPLDAVVNLAGAPIADRPWTAARRRLLWDSRIGLTGQLVDWLARRQLRPGVLLSGSAVGWYGDGGERRLNEDSPAGSEDFASELCFAWEAAALRAEELGIRVVLVRTAPVLAARGGMLARLLPPFRLGLGGRMGSGRQWMPWIHLEDEVGLIDFLLHHEDCRGPYNACAPNPVRNAEFARTLGRVLHRPALLPAPACVLRLALGEMAGLLLGGQHLQPQRTLDAGYRFRFPDLEAALADLLARH